MNRARNNIRKARWKESEKEGNQHKHIHKEIFYFRKEVEINAWETKNVPPILNATIQQAYNHYRKFRSLCSLTEEELHTEKGCGKLQSWKLGDDDCIPNEIAEVQRVALNTIKITIQQTTTRVEVQYFNTSVQSPRNT